MNNVRVFLVLPLLIFTGIGRLSGQANPGVASATSAELTPGVPAIIKMHQSGVPSDMIIKAVEASVGLKTLTPNDLIALKGANVPDDVIRAITGQPQQSPSPGTAQSETPAQIPMQVSPSAAVPMQLPPPMDLRSVKRIYVERMPEDLDQYIRAEITKKFKGAVLVVLREEGADAIMTGVGQKKDGVGAAITGRYLGLHDNATGAVSLVDKSGTVVLWSSEAGDRSLWWGALKRGGPRKVADRLINNLKNAMGK